MDYLADFRRFPFMAITNGIILCSNFLRTIIGSNDHEKAVKDVEEAPKTETKTVVLKVPKTETNPASNVSKKSAKPRKKAVQFHSRKRQCPFRIDVTKPTDKYLEAYDEKHRKTCKAGYLAIKRRKLDFELPEVSSMTEAERSLLKTYGENTKGISDLTNEFNQAPVFLIFNQSLGRKAGLKNLMLPKFEYGITNVLEDGATTLTRSRCNDPIEQNKWLNGRNNCSSNKCYCQTRKMKLLGDREDLQQLFYNKSGMVDLKNYKSGKYDYIIECSSACGCDIKCCQRVLQRGSRIPLAIIRENEQVGFGVRAVVDIQPGRFICEMVGEVMSTSSDNYINPRLAFTCGVFLKNTHVVSLTDVANVARFINHCCEPNASFVNVYSRVDESDPWIPRIGVYANTHIRAGDEITVAYNERNATGSSQIAGNVIECGCSAKNCWKQVKV